MRPASCRLLGERVEMRRCRILSPRMALRLSLLSQSPKFGYVEQWNFDIQRQLPGGFFADVAYAGSHGVHLEQYSTNINQIPDSFVAQAAAQATTGATPTIATSFATAGQTNPLNSPDPSLQGGKPSFWDSSTGRIRSSRGSV